MSKTACFYPIVGAMSGAVDYLGTKDWGTVNDTQAEFMEKFYHSGLAEASSMKNIETRASKVAQDLNDWMAERGFNIKLEDFEGNDFGVVSILDVMVEWADKGTRRKLRVNDTDFDAVRISNDFMTTFKVQGHEHDIARLDTKNANEFVYITKASKELESLPLMAEIKKLDLRSRIRREATTKYEDVIFPMVDLNQEVNIGWLKKVYTIQDTPQGKDKYEVAQALQQTKFRMNEVGARAESAVAIGMLRMASKPKPSLVIDGPFYVWIAREGLSMPLFAGYITPEDWKDPKTLGDQKPATDADRSRFSEEEI